MIVILKNSLLVHPFPGPVGERGWSKGDNYNYIFQYELEKIHVHKQNLLPPLMPLPVALLQHHHFNQTDSCLLLFELSLVFILFKFSLWLSAYLAKLSGRCIETGDHPLVPPFYLCNCALIDYEVMRKKNQVFAVSLHVLYFFICYLHDYFFCTRVYSIIIKSSCIIIMRI